MHWQGGEVCTKPGCTGASVNSLFTSICSKFTHIFAIKMVLKSLGKKKKKKKEKGGESKSETERQL